MHPRPHPPHPPLRSNTSTTNNSTSFRRNRYLERFVGEVVEVANRLRPTPDRVVGDVRETFASKLALSMRLAISKYKPIQVQSNPLFFADCERYPGKEGEFFIPVKQAPPFQGLNTNPGTLKPLL